MSVLDSTEISSVGTVVGAALETAGHFMQSSFIDILEGGLAVSLGALFYVVAIITALTIITSGGNYKFGRWFLIGPILFYATCFTRVDSCGVVVRRGDVVYDADVVWDSTKGLVSEEICSERPARVSFFFKAWNNLTSVTINSFVKLLRLEHRGSDFDFISKTDRYIGMLNNQVTDPVIKDFMTTVVQGPCAGVYAKMFALMQKNMADDRRQIVQQELDLLIKNTVINLSQYPALQTVIQQYVSPDKRPAPDAVLDCSKLWGLGIDILNTHAVSILADIADVSQFKNDEDRARQVFDKLQKKWSLRFDNESGNLDVLEPEVAIMRIINEKAVRLFLDEFRELNPAIPKGDLNQTQINTLAGIKVGGEEEIAEVLRSSSTREENQSKGDFLKYMMALPYVQGILLYFLALTYPFFCLFLIIPGRHLTFLYWFGLWTWVKLWDFGFAVVMLIDELLYTLMPRGPFIDEVMSQNPVEAIKAALEVDPTYSVHIYYNILATCLLAVPALTAMATKAGSGVLLNAVNNAFKTFSGDVGGGLASYAGSQKAQSNMAAVRKNSHNAVMDSLYNQFAGVAPDIASAALMNAGLGITKDHLPKIFGDLQQRASRDMMNPNLSDTEKSALQAKRDKFGEAKNESEKWLDPKSGATSAFAHGMVRAHTDHEKRVQWQRLSYALNMIAFEASATEPNQRLALDARVHGYYSHNLFAPYPYNSHLQLMADDMYYQWSSPVKDSAQIIADRIFYSPSNIFNTLFDATEKR